jgi:small conductance mechanosensitive channel
MPPPSSLLDTPPTCAGDKWCNYVEKLTGNAWLAQGADWLIAKPLAILGLVVVALVARWVLHRLIDRLAHRAGAGVPNPLNRARAGRAGSQQVVSVTQAAARRAQRATTMASLLKSITTGVIFSIVGIMVVAELGYNVAPLIASAGIIGLAFGFGAQSLVKDLLSGIFMIVEDQYGVGDSVDLGYAIGVVEAVGLRVTRLRDVEGTVWYVRNGEILRVGNQSQNWARTVLDVPVSHNQDLRHVQAVLKEVAHGLWDDEDFAGQIIEEPEVWGVQDLTPDWITVRVTLKTAPLEQWAVARELRERVKARFDHEGIELARPAREIWVRDGRPVVDTFGPPEPSPEPSHVP